MTLFPNKVVKATIEHAEYNGSKYERVKYISECDTVQSTTAETVNNLEDFEEILSDDDVPF